MKRTDYLKDVKVDVISKFISKEMSCKCWGVVSPGSKCKQCPVEVLSPVVIFRVCCNLLTYNNNKSRPNVGHGDTQGPQITLRLLV